MAAENQRLAGLDQDAIEEELRAEIGQHALDDIVFAGGNAAREQQQIRIGKTALDQASRGFVVVARDRQKLGDPTRAPHLRGQRPRVRIANLKFARLFARFDNLIAGRKNRHARPRDRRKRTRARPSRAPRSPRIRAAAPAEHRIAAAALRPRVD